MLVTTIRRVPFALLGAALLGLAGLATAPPAAASLPGASSVLTRAPYLSDLTTTSVQVNWGTASQYRGVVEYGTPGDCTAFSVTSATLGSPITINGVTEYQNSVPVTGLSPGTTYCYRVTDNSSSPTDLLGSNSSPEFTTLEPANGTSPITFDVLGDWGDTTNGAVNDGSLNVNQAGVDARIAASGAQFAITTGDIAYQGGTQTNYGDLNQTGADISAVFGPSYWAAPGESLPLYAVSGNHGQNSTFLTNWPEPTYPALTGGSYAMLPYASVDGTTPGKYPSSYYAFTAGGVRFYMLDAAWGNSNVGAATGGSCGANCAIYQVDHDAHWTVTSAEYQWLVRDLAAHPGGVKLAFFHFPLHADNATQTSDAYLENTPGSAGTLEQLLHNNGVQLVFNGHAHIYQRNIATPGGVTSYVTGGGGGQAEPVSHCSITDAYAVGWSYSSSAGSACGAAPKPLSDAQVYHFLKVTVNGTRVTVTPIDSLGDVFDPQTYNFASDATTPTAPGSLAVTQPATGGNLLTWTAATDNIGVTAYDVYRSGQYLATAGPGVRTYTDLTAASGVKYTYRVAARDLAGNTASASVTTGGRSDTTAPTAPSSLTAAVGGPTQASLSWKASTDKSGIFGYTILRNGTAVARVGSAVTSYIDTELSPGTSYSYKVTAMDTAGNVSPASNKVTITTTADTTPPTAPGSLTANSATSSQVSLSWTPASDNVSVVRYDVVRDGSVIASSAGPSYIDTSAAPDTTYTYQVVAYDAAGNATPSGTLLAATPIAGAVFSDGFESGSLWQWSTVNGLTAESSVSEDGAYGAEESSAGSATYAYESLPGSYTELWGQAWVYVNSQSTSANLIGFRGSNGGSIINLYVTGTGKLALRNNVGGVTTTSATSLPAGSWHRLVLHAVINGTSSSVDVSMDGTAVSDLSLTGQNLGANPVATFQLGDTSTGRTYDVYFDDVAVSQKPL